MQPPACRLLDPPNSPPIDPFLADRLRNHRHLAIAPAALEHFLANEWRDAHAQKRGGKFTFVSTDAGTAEQQYLQVPAANLSPEQLFEQQWAVTLLDQTLTRLQQEFVASGKGVLFGDLKIFLTGEKRPLRMRNYRRNWE